jgi:peptide/nickel transport system ATP-binding protein
LPIMTALLEVRDLTVHYPLPFGIGEIMTRSPRRVVQAVNGVNLRLERGETLGLVGESGCGKSSLGRAILRLIEAKSGRVLFDGTDVLALDKAGLFAFRKRAQMVFQEPHASLNPRLTVAETLAEVLRVHRVCPRAAIEARVPELLEAVGLSADLGARRAAALSGGQCQRVAIARALAMGPELLISDESVSALDVSIQAQILNLFMRLKREMDLTMMFISHDLSVVRHVCHRVAVMYLGRIVEFGPTEQIFRDPKHPYTQALLRAIPRMDPDAEPPAAAAASEPPSPVALSAGCAFHPRCPQAMDVCRGPPAPALRRSDQAEVACHLYPV